VFCAGDTDGFTLQNSHIENSGDDTIGVWSTGTTMLYLCENDLFEPFIHFKKMIILTRQARDKHGTRETLKNRLPFSYIRIRNVTLKNPSVTAGPQSNWGSCMGTYAFTSLTLDGFRCAPTRFCVFLHLAREPALTNFKSLLF
jgi:hypothetical protein